MRCYVCQESCDEPSHKIGELLAGTTGTQRVFTKSGYVSVHRGACRYALNAVDTPSMYAQHIRGELRERAK